MKRNRNNKRAMICAMRRCDYTLCRLHDGIVSDLIKFKILSIINKVIEGKKEQGIDSENNPLRKIWRLTKEGTSRSILSALAYIKAPQIFKLIASGAGIMTVAVLFTLLKKLFGVVTNKSKN